jgi:hypothetical protein
MCPYDETSMTVATGSVVINPATSDTTEPSDITETVATSEKAETMGTKEMTEMGGAWETMQ